MKASGAFAKHFFKTDLGKYYFTGKSCISLFKEPYVRRTTAESMAITWCDTENYVNCAAAREALEMDI